MSIALQRSGTLFVLVAPSGGGKSTVLKALLEKVPGLAYSVSVTSRRPRPGEKEGQDFHYVSVREFQDMIERKEFYEWAQVHGNFYGTRKETVEELLKKGLDVGMDLDVQGACAIKGMKRDAVTIFLLPPSMQTLEERLRGRDTDDDEVIALRLTNAADEIARCKLFDYLVVNKDLDEVIEEITGIVHAERNRSTRQKLLVEDEPKLTRHLDRTA
ncbi:MAG: guanylate kinase [Candidatus Sumerlaeota bacterium]